MIFKSAEKCHFLRVGDEEKRLVPMKGDDGKEWEIGVGHFSVVSHTGRGKGESGRDANASACFEEGWACFTHIGG